MPTSVLGSTDVFRGFRRFCSKHVFVSHSINILVKQNGRSRGTVIFGFPNDWCRHFLCPLIPGPVEAPMHIVQLMDLLPTHYCEALATNWSKCREVRDKYVQKKNYNGNLGRLIWLSLRLYWHLHNEKNLNFLLDTQSRWEHLAIISIMRLISGKKINQKKYSMQKKHLKLQKRFETHRAEKISKSLLSHVIIGRRAPAALLFPAEPLVNAARL